MLDIAFELIGEATSNSLLMFCFCNLIIVMIFTGSLKPGLKDSQDSTFLTSVSYDMRNIASDHHDCGDDDKEMTITAAIPTAQDELLIDDDSSSDEEEDSESSHCYADDDDDTDEDDDDEEGDEDESKESEAEEEEEGDDDLRMRVEEFIAKINNEWRHEKLRSLNLVY